MSVKVFVYGTLRMGESRHGVPTFQKVLAEEAFINGFDMLDVGAFPGLVPNPELEDADPHIRGEVHEYENLEVLDRIEGYNPGAPGKGLYSRRQVTAYTRDDQIEDCWVYILNARPGVSLGRYKVVQGGDWLQHREAQRGRVQSLLE